MASNADYITYLYQKVWGRAPDSEGLAYWLSQMSNGLSSGELVETFLNHSVFNQQYMPIANLYKLLFNSKPDLEGLNFWVNEMNKGADVKALANFFTTLDGHSSIFAGTTDDAFIKSLYTNALGREADAEGLQYWLNELQTSQLSRGDIAAIFANLDQTSEHTQNEIHRDIIYQTFFDRPMTPQEGGLSYDTALSTLVTTLLESTDNVAPIPEDIVPATLLSVSFTDDAMVLTGTPNGDVIINLSQENWVSDNGIDITITEDEIRDEVNASSISANIHLTASSTALTMKTGSGDDTLIGNDGIDLFYAGAGTDALYGGAGLDIFYIENLADADGLNETYDGQVGSANIVLSETGSVDLSSSTLASINVLQFSETGNTVSITYEQLNHIATLNGSAYEDTIVFMTSGYIDTSTSQFTNIENFVGAATAQNEFIGGVGALSQSFQGGDQGDFFEPGGGNDTIIFGDGADIVRYNFASESQYSGGSTLDTDTFNGFDFLEDKIKLDYAIDGAATRITLANVFMSELASELESSATIQAAFGDADNDVVLLTISSGTAQGTYLLIEDTTDQTGFDTDEDMIIQLTGTLNPLQFGTSDFIS